MVYGNNASPIEKGTEIPGLVGESPGFCDLKRLIPLVSQSEASVLIMGETGTGKEVVARAIHYQGDRKAFPFIPLNCGALPDGLFENELFGHTQGAYTDAKGTTRGVLAEAENGTLFLDEIDSLSLCSQVKILRLLQEKEYRPLGSAKIIKANIRLIAATNKNLVHLIQANKFREDLYYRLNVLPMVIPPLRERMDDIPRLTEYFLGQQSDLGNERYHEIVQEISRLSLTYDWPGNIRELESMIQRMVVINGEQLEDNQCFLTDSDNNSQLNEMTWQQIKKQELRKLEARFLRQVMYISQGNVSRGSKLAGIDRRSFQRMLRKHSVLFQPL